MQKERFTIRLKRTFEKFDSTLTRIAGSTTAFIIACALVFVWAVCGYFFHYSEKWQLFF